MSGGDDYTDPDDEESADRPETDDADEDPGRPHDDADEANDDEPGIEPEDEGDVDELGDVDGDEVEADTADGDRDDESRETGTDDADEGGDRNLRKVPDDGGDASGDDIDDGDGDDADTDDSDASEPSPGAASGGSSGDRGTDDEDADDWQTVDDWSPIDDGDEGTDGPDAGVDGDGDDRPYDPAEGELGVDDSEMGLTERAPDAADEDTEGSDADGGESGGAEAVDIERFDPETTGMTTEADEVDEGAASDGGTVTAGNTVGSPVEDYADEGFVDGPEYDQEMPLADHIEEMMTRLLAVIVVMAVVSAPTFLYADQIIQFVWNSILGAAGSQARPHIYTPLALVLARLKTATLAGFIVALPVFVYETYLFMRPGLYPKERRYYLAAVPTSLVLASVGVLFAFALVLPAIFVYFVTYSEQAAQIAFGLTDTYGLMLTMMGFFALIFQIPLFIMLAIMMGLTSRKWLAERRILFWGAFVGISAMFAFDPTGMAPLIVALTMVLLFEGTLFLLRWVERGKAFFSSSGSDAEA